AIVGLGAIGRALARAAAALGMTVVGTRKTAAGAPPEGVTDAFGPEGLPTVLACADFVVLAAPLTDETRGMIDAPQLRLMRPSAWLINVARGKLVNETALVDALRRGGIAGAALDVFDREPLDASSPLWSLPNVLVTPHVGGFRSGYWEAAVDLFAENLGRFAKNERLRNTVDKAAGY
ncbi:MAG TPA: NAD(P)-dependent oxidoreductase, partial [Vicinamibacterales bacterium]|nr:NAD(P)-dependent oxidoreductase [Vicinamibacterales bacterium]